MIPNLHITAKSCRAAWLLPMAAALCLAASPGRGEEPAAKTETEIVVPKSVFVDDKSFGRDPFFPNSSRRSTVSPAPVQQQPVADKPALASKGPLSVHLALKGVTISTNRFVALIDSGVRNYTLEAGEEVLVRTPDGPVRIKCLEIKEASVALAVDGEKENKQLSLKSGI